MSNSHSHSAQCTMTDTHQHVQQVFVETPYGIAHEVTLDYFTANILPPLHPHIDLDSRLRKRALRRVITKEDKWWGYSSRLPGAHPKTDFSKTYSHLERGVRMTVNAVRKVNPRLMFHVNKEGEPRYEQRTAAYLPDAFFVTTPVTEGPFRWEDIAVIGEFHRFEDTRYILEVGQKVAKSMTLCMQADPRRRFIYGFTIENTKTRLWYGDRSWLLVSQPFSFVENYQAFLSFVLRVSFAETHQLGWDPTIHRVASNGQVQYDITVHPCCSNSLTYRTLALITDSGAVDLLGRGTRVWKAVRIVNGEETGAPVVLKDAWVDSDREREGDIHWRLLHSDHFEKERPELKEHFIAVEVHGDVMLMGSTDCTPCSSRGPSNAHVRSRSQTHYRIVYSEIGESLRNITSLRTIFQTLGDAVRGVSAMHAAGWVHRDLSAGNILIVNGKGKIHDVELATNNWQSEAGERIGTAEFMAVEVDRQEYLFPPAPSELPSPPSDSSFAESSPEDPVKIRPAFQYSPLHDLESLWWNAVWFTLNREIDADVDGTFSRNLQERTAHRISAMQLFYEQKERWNAFHNRHGFAHRLRCLHPVLKDISKILDEMQWSLRREYVRVEQSIVDMSPSLVNELGESMRKQLEKVVAILQDRDIIIRRFDPGFKPSLVDKIG